MAVRLEVIDVAGRKVRDLIGGEQRAAGEYSVEWDGTAERGDRAASGVYFIRLRAGSDQIVRRVALLAD
jgi:flagellar hook assembly protein FlgD